MILELIVKAFMAVVRGIVGLLPTAGAPGWLADGSSMLSDSIALGSGLSAWIPFSIAGTVLAAVLSCVAAGFIIKVVRIVASFLTAGGGSAA